MCKCEWKKIDINKHWAKSTSWDEELNESFAMTNDETEKMEKNVAQRHCSRIFSADAKLQVLHSWQGPAPEIANYNVFTRRRSHLLHERFTEATALSIFMNACLTCTRISTNHRYLHFAYARPRTSSHSSKNYMKNIQICKKHLFMYNYFFNYPFKSFLFSNCVFLFY